MKKPEANKRAEPGPHGDGVPDQGVTDPRGL